MKSLIKKIKSWVKKEKPEPVKISYADLEPKDPKVLEEFKDYYIIMSALEVWRFEHFKKQHSENCPCKDKKHLGYSLKICNNSGIGVGFDAICEACGCECDLTDYGSW